MTNDIVSTVDKNKTISPFESTLPQIKVTKHATKKSSEAIKIEEDLKMMSIERVSPARQRAYEKERAKPQKEPLKPVDFMNMN